MLSMIEAIQRTGHSRRLRRHVTMFQLHSTPRNRLFMVLLHIVSPEDGASRSHALPDWIRGSKHETAESIYACAADLARLLV